MIKRILIFVTILLVLDIYLIFGFKNFFNNQTTKVAFKWFYIISMLVSYACFTTIILNIDNRPTKGTLWINLWFGYTFAFIVLRLGMFNTFAFDDIVRLVEFCGKLIVNLFSKNNTEVNLSERRKFIGQVGLGLASIPFLSMLYGITKGKYNYKVKEVALSFKNLPKAFHGLKIVHISDVHSGSFDDFDEVAHGVNLIKQQQADLVLFTGDLVNNEAKEIIPYKDLFGSINTPLGKFSSLGNHDYGTHKRWKTREEKQKNLQELFVHQKDMGFELLNNKTVTLTKSGEGIDIVGVENWGKPPFPQKGDLDFSHNSTFDPLYFILKNVPKVYQIKLTKEEEDWAKQY